MQKVLLGVNIDHVATLRETRKERYPDPIHAALLAEQAGADLITLHLREDRRHIQDQDVTDLKPRLKTKMNLEIAVTDEMLNFACQIQPEQVCLVPEKREELTTEGGLDILNNKGKIAEAVNRLNEVGIRVSLFVDPNYKQIDAAREVAAHDIEIHTGGYANLPLHSNKQLESLKTIMSSVQHGQELGLRVNAGHGLNYHNICPIAAIPGIAELNIGHAIIARAVFSGLESAVREMKELIYRSR